MHSILVPAALLAACLASGAQTVALPSAPAQHSPGDSTVVTLPGPSQAAQKADAHALDMGAQLLAKTLAYVGGGDKLEALRDITVTETSELQGAQGPVTQKMVTYEVLPDTIRQEMQSARGVMVFFVNADTGWMLGANGVQNLSDSGAGVFQSEMARNMMLLLIYLNSVKAAAVYQGAGDLRVTTRRGETVTLHVDEKTGAPLSVSYIFRNSNVVATYGDWRPVSGVKMPFRLDVEMDGRPILHSATTRIQTNTNLTSAELAAHQ